MQRAIERVRGFSDIDAVTFQRYEAVLQSLKQTFGLAGFNMIDVPLIEHLELYMRKNGAQVISKLYGFTDQGRREVALRPEFTASVIRALAPSVDHASEPIRVSYAGPVFRYEKPQRATTRQFTQVGIELLGEASPSADADLLALACQAATAAGVPTIHAVIGHLGPLRALLAHLNVDGYAEGYMLEHLEYYSRGPAQQIHVRHQLGLDSPTTDDGERNDGAALADALSGLSPEAARDVVNGLLRQMGVDLASNTRTPDEIIERVLDKAQRHAALRSGARRESLERALQFCSSLTELRGEPHLVLREAEQLLRSYDVPLSALDELGEVVRLFQEHGLPNVRITLAPGMARGIAYYSGLIFELYAEPTGTSGEFTELQICGGGRYDSLPLAITGRHSFPALGFAFGLERLSHCLPADAIKGAEVLRVAIVIDNRHTRKAGLVLADRLRRAGFAAVLHAPKATDSRLREQLIRAGYAAMVQMPSGGTVQIGSPNANEGSIVLLDHGLSTDEIAALVVAVREVPIDIADEVSPVAAIGGAT